MSLVITTYVPEGIVMASDSRQSINIKGKTPQGKDFKVETVNSDTVTKTFLLEEQNVGISSFGKDLLGGVPMASHIKRFSEEILTDKDDVESVAEKILKFMQNEFKKVDTGFHVCGYRKENKISIPYVFSCHVGRNEIIRKNIRKDGSLYYGATWSGQGDIISGLINPVVIKDNKGNKKIIKPAAPIAWGAMPLQDAIDFSIFAIRTTIDTIRFQARPKNVGGPIDVLVLTPDFNKWIQKKELHI
jgi:hypothetical protein